MKDHGQLEVGYHDAQRCPNCRLNAVIETLSEGDLFAIEWFNRNVTGFAMESGMISGLVDELGFEGVSKELFLLKLNLIYQSIQRSQMEEYKNG